MTEKIVPEPAIVKNKTRPLPFRRVTDVPDVGDRSVVVDAAPEDLLSWRGSRELRRALGKCGVNGFMIMWGATDRREPHDRSDTHPQVLAVPLVDGNPLDPVLATDENLPRELSLRSENLRDLRTLTVRLPEVDISPETQTVVLHHPFYSPGNH